jgi:mannan polymerase II complex MNN10 subunit
MRRLSNNLPRFNAYGAVTGEKEKAPRSRWDLRSVPLVGRIRSIAGRMGRKMKMRLLFVFIILLSVWIFYHSRKLQAIPKRTLRRY